MLIPHSKSLFQFQTSLLHFEAFFEYLIRDYELESLWTLQLLVAVLK